VKKVVYVSLTIYKTSEIKSLSPYGWRVLRRSASLLKSPLRLKIFGNVKWANFEEVSMF